MKLKNQQLEEGRKKMEKSGVLGEIQQQPMPISGFLLT